MSSGQFNPFDIDDESTYPPVRPLVGLELEEIGISEGYISAACTLEVSAVRGSSAKTAYFLLPARIWLGSDVSLDEVTGWRFSADASSGCSLI